MMMTGGKVKILLNVKTHRQTLTPGLSTSFHNNHRKLVRLGAGPGRHRVGGTSGVTTAARGQEGSD